MSRALARRSRIVPASVAVLPLLLVGGLLALAWSSPGYVVCEGYLEPEGWVPVYSPDDGTIRDGTLRDGRPVTAGEVLLRLDDRWILGQIRQIRGGSEVLEIQAEHLRRQCALFDEHYRVEEAELRRLLEADRMMAANAGISRSELEHRRYLLSSFIAGSARERCELDFEKQRVDAEIRRYEIDRAIWESRLEETRLTAPASGRFFIAETLRIGSMVTLTPDWGPGRRLEAGQLLGFIVPGMSMRVRIGIPEHRLAGCSAGDRVLVSSVSRSPWRNPPLIGTLESLSEVASGGRYGAVVALESPQSSDDDVASLACGRVIVRIRTGSQGRDSGSGLWDRWIVLADSFGRKKGRLE